MSFRSQIKRGLRSWLRKIWPRWDTQIVVETSSQCNVRCSWCWMYYAQKKDMGLMSFENFKRFIDLNKKYFKSHNISVCPYSRGEPLIHPKFFEMIDYAAAQGIRLLEINTNLSMKVDIERLMESPLPGILVNIGGTTEDTHQKVMSGSNLELVKNNLKKMLSANKFNKKIRIKMNATKHNAHQLTELASFFKSLGGDPKNATIGTLRFTPLANAPKEGRIAFLKDNVSKEISQYLRFYYDDEGNITSKSTGCNWLIPSVRWDGKVTLCCHDQLNALNLGNAFHTPVKNIFESKEFKNATAIGKKRGFLFCKYCA